MLNICTNQRITKVFDSQIFYDIFLHFVSNIILPNKMHILLPCPALEYRKISIFNTFTHSVKIFSYFLSRITLIIDGRRKPRPGLPSGKECCKQSDPEQLVVRRSEGNWTRAWYFVLRTQYQNKYGSMKPRPRLVHASVARGIIVFIHTLMLFILFNIMFL